MQMSLRDWAEAYLRHRDLFERAIAQMHTTGEHERAMIAVRRKDGTRLVCAVGDLTQDSLEQLKEQQVLFIARNRKRNVEFLREHWAAFTRNPETKVVFVHVALNEKWIIRPSTHDKVTEPESLALGLEALHASVPQEDQ